MASEMQSNIIDLWYKYIFSEQRVNRKTNNGLSIKYGTFQRGRVFRDVWQRDKGRNGPVMRDVAL